VADKKYLKLLYFSVFDILNSMKNPYAGRSHEEMRDVLMSPDASGPDIHYYMIRGGDAKTNITVWETGKVGDEYIKSHGHYHVGLVDETYTILQGTGIVILQKRKLDNLGLPIDDEIESFQALQVKPGDYVFIPAGMGHLAVNTDSTWFVTSDDSPVNFEDKDPAGAPGHADYAPFKKLHGAAYYVVEKNGAPALVKNPNYKTVPPASIE
jgi:oxalate decarboxylase/phosphoglucose isomerase-like protein (cupin superfamily)